MKIFKSAVLISQIQGKIFEIFGDRAVRTIRTIPTGPLWTVQGSSSDSVRDITLLTRTRRTRTWTDSRRRRFTELWLKHF